MASQVHTAISPDFSVETAKTSVFKKFLNWSEGQEYNRLLWSGISLGGHGCVITPLTFLFVVLTGINMTMLIITMLSMVAVLIVNLAALPTRITIPVFILSIIADIVIISACAAMAF